MEKIVVSSVGILSALGCGMHQNIQALLHKKSGLHYPVHLQSVHAQEFLLGEVNFSNEDLATLIGLQENFTGFTRTTLLSLVALQELIGKTDRELLRNEPLAFINSSTVGGMCSVEDYYLDFIEPGKRGDFIQYINSSDCGDSTERGARYFGLKPLMATISTACSSSANAIIMGARLIQQGVVKRAICGGTDGLSRFTLNGFNSLKNVDKEPCRPFDQTRFGLNLGEGAGYLLLEKETDAKARGAEILAYLDGYANSNDAYHPTAPSPDGAGALRTMEQALKHARLKPGAISYINAHGTATINNDVAEGLAIQQLFAPKVPYFSSTKAFTGHTLAAAGAIEAIFSIISLQQQTIFANLNFTTPMEELSITPVTDTLQNVPVQHVMSNSFGFGGNNVSLIFSK